MTERQPLPRIPQPTPKQRKPQLKDPSPDLYKIMDEAGLDAGTFLSGKKSTIRIVTEVRAKLLAGMLAYLKKLEEANGAEK